MLIASYIDAVAAANIRFTDSMTQALQSAPCTEVSTEIVAPRIAHSILLNAAHPAGEWETATPQMFCADWQGNHSEKAHETAVRVLWSPHVLYVRFECRYRDLNMFPDSESDGRRDHLWERDVAELFLQPDPSRPGNYSEIEISPNGLWLDLAIFPGGRFFLNSGMQSSVFLDEEAKTWTAEMAIPMNSLTTNFDPGSPWRVNFFRVEGVQEPRRYMSWQPTFSVRPNFHVPSAFGTLRFADES